jgi:Winged helix-turn-helix DNA-binding
MRNTTPFFQYSAPTSVTGISMPITPHALTEEKPASKIKPVGNERIDSAVYSHIQALKVLGNNRVNTSDIAKSLGLSLKEVNDSIKSLESRGVKIV